LTGKLPDACLDQLFREARTHNAWRDKPVPDALLQAIVDLLKLGPTSANCSPARFLFVKSREEKERLKPHLSEGNSDKTMKAPVCTVIGFDLDFYLHFPKLFPHTDAKSWFEGKKEKIAETAFRNGTLQGAYIIMAARAFGLDCGRCRASTIRASIANSLPAPTSNRTSCAVSAMATRACCSRGRRASASTKWRGSSKKPR